MSPWGGTSTCPQQASQLRPHKGGRETLSSSTHVSVSDEASGEPQELDPRKGEIQRESWKLPETPGWSRKTSLTQLALEDFLEEVASQELFKLWEDHGFIPRGWVWGRERTGPSKGGDECQSPGGEGVGGAN